MPVAFSLPSRPSTVRASTPPEDFGQYHAADGGDAASERQFILEFDTSIAPTETPELVIPPIENTWWPLKKKRGIDLLLSDSTAFSGIVFDAADPYYEADLGISNGLDLRASENEGDERPRVPPSKKSVEDMTLEKFRKDIKELPDEQGFDRYKDVPVVGFGAAYLAGYGWSEGKGIGRNAKEDVPVERYAGWIGRQGLGFVQPQNVDKKNASYT